MIHEHAMKQEPRFSPCSNHQIYLLDFVCSFFKLRTSLYGFVWIKLILLKLKIEN